MNVRRPSQLVQPDGAAGTIVVKRTHGAVATATFTLRDIV